MIRRSARRKQMARLPPRALRRGRRADGRTARDDTVARPLADVGDRRPPRLPARVLALRLRRRARRGDDPVHERRRCCPGDDDLDHVLDAEALVEALNSTFRIVEICLDRWTLEMLDEEIRRSWGTEEERVYIRGSVIQRVFAHDVYHCAELNEMLATLRLPLVDFWD